jgi:signal transduction histidine kinase
VNNIARHSGATEASIDFELGANHLALCVRDNGRGFTASCPQQGNGLGNMRRRAAAMGGSMDVESLPAKGTSIHVSAPF